MTNSTPSTFKFVPRPLKIPYDRLPYQHLFHESTKPKAFLSAGYGAGKTYALAMKAFRLMAVNRGLPGGLLCPTMKMFKRDVLPTFREICAEHNIPMEYKKAEAVFNFPTTRSEIYVYHSEDDGDSIKGANLAFGLINEVNLCTKGAFDALLSRIRLKKATLLQLAMSGTPEGFNWSYEYFVEKPRDDTDLIFGDMRLNRFVAGDYAQNLMDSYDAIMVQQYVEGKFVNLIGGRAAWAFDRFKHTAPDIEPIQDAPVWVSIDFNVDPMTATLWNVVPAWIEGPHWIRAFDEIVIPNSNTPELCKVLHERLAPIQHGELVMFPDPAGRNRSTQNVRVDRSDISILRDNGFEEIRYKRKISVRDCLMSMNTLLGKNRVIINSKKCPNLIADLEQCIIKPGTNEIDKSNPKRTHSLDGFKNMADYEFPAYKNRGTVREHRLR